MFFYQVAGLKGNPCYIRRHSGQILLNIRLFWFFLYSGAFNRFPDLIKILLLYAVIQTLQGRQLLPCQGTQYFKLVFQFLFPRGLLFPAQFFQDILTVFQQLVQIL